MGKYKLGGGFLGKILKVDLTTGDIVEKTLNESFYRTWLGGYGLGARVVYDEITPRANPLMGGNIIGFTTGILTGSLTPFSGGFTVVGKSPLTGTWGDSRGGGYFGPELKFAGFDAVFFSGKSKKPIYLWINDGKAEIRTASALWGKDTIETESLIREQCNDERIQVACIGQSGEKLSKISCIITDKGRAAGRSGFGALMGSKKLKAVAVRGTGKIKVADLEGLVALRKRFVDQMNREENWKTWSKYGTTQFTESSAHSGDSPVKNWAGAGDKNFPMAEKINDSNLSKYLVRKYSCYGCPLGCGAIVEVKDGRYKVKDHRPEYETLAAFGSLCLNDNLESIIYLNKICNRHGLDTISTGGTIAFAIECYENGIITKGDTGGIELTWGNHEAIVEMTEKMARREGFGSILADGAKAAADKIGRGANRFAMHVGGQEVPMHDPKWGPGLGTTYVASPTPARHTQGTEGYIEGNGELQIALPGLEAIAMAPNHALMVYQNNVVQALGLCIFIDVSHKTKGVPDYRDFLEAVTGWKIGWRELLVCGERIECMRQAFNVREGFKPRDFILPERIRGKPPLKAGPHKNKTLDIESRVIEYYDHIGWDSKTGRPSKEKLRSLGLKDVANDLWG